MIRKAIIIFMTLAAVATAGLILIAPDDRTWYYRDGDGLVVGSTQVGVSRGYLRICRFYTSDLINSPPPLLADIQMYPLYTRTRVRYSDRFKLYANTDPRFVTEIYEDLTLVGPLIVFSVYPTIAFIRGPLRRYRRRKRGWCIHCGYDLRGNVTGVCSECGKPSRTTTDNTWKCQEEWDDAFSDGDCQD